MTQSINLMPKKYCTKLGDHRVRRRFVIQLVAGLIIVGAAGMHQRYHLADRKDGIESALLRLADLDDARAHLKQLDQSRRVLVDELARYQRACMPIELSRVVATTSAMIPDGIAVNVLHTKVIETQQERSSLDSLSGRTKRARKGKNKDQTETVRTLSVELSGAAESDLEISQLLANLEEHKLLNRVELEYSHMIEMNGQPKREFRIHFQVNMMNRYLPELAQVSAEDKP